MLIIAECGMNHNGDLKLAKQLVDKAKWAGADIVKFQVTRWGRIFFGEHNNPVPQHLKSLVKHYKKNDTYYIENIYKDKDWAELKKYCDKKKIRFMGTPFDIGSVELLEDLGVDAFKVRSSDLDNHRFLEYVAEKKKPIILSTGNPNNENGMATHYEIDSALQILKGAYVILLQCVSKYPCFDSRQDRIPRMNVAFKKPVGLSDHTQNIYITKIDNIPILEKHLMLDDIDCPDKSVSLFPGEFKKMVEFVRFGKW